MTIKLPNLLTYSRIVAVPVVVVLMLVERPLGNWLALGVFVAAGVTDILDGHLARRWGQQSSLGRILDPIADKLLVSAVLLMLVGVDTLQGLTLLPAAIILCREILVSGLREFLADVRVSVPVSRLAKWKTGLQMTTIGFLIVGEAGPHFGPFTTTQVGVGGLWVAAVLTVVTGFDYLVAGLRHVRAFASGKSARSSGGR
ncbi:MAG: CDP-diacylglycerol--glycerol-3-phosphate 3-phosphatidyltransferase [Rhodospirillales bacterium]|nr:CDP-diacylglycerol--glycerol-3-phosphate 3-phosphatidyltransferase [Rhodospirillales bacterium]